MALHIPEPYVAACSGPGGNMQWLYAYSNLCLSVFSLKQANFSI